MLPYPKKFKISSGAAVSKRELLSFDKALIDEGIDNYNLLRVSSILPVGCVQADTVDKQEGSALLVAYGAYSSNVCGETIASAVGIGVPNDPDQVGVIMEYAGINNAAEAEQIVREMVTDAMENHKIECADILVSSVEKTITTDEYVSVISAVSLW